MAILKRLAEKLFIAELRHYFACGDAAKLRLAALLASAAGTKWQAAAAGAGMCALTQGEGSGTRGGIVHALLIFECLNPCGAEL